MERTARYVCHVITGHVFRPVWNETQTAIRNLSDTLCKFMNRDDTTT
jgi:hypothetical protein